MPSARQQVSLALCAISVTFPMITEICERVDAVPSEACEAVTLLLDVCSDLVAPARKWLQALTIILELAHVPVALKELQDSKRARPTMLRLQAVKDTGLGAAEENLRIFATEMLKVLPADPVSPVPWLSLPSWPTLPSWPRFPQWDCLATDHAMGYGGAKAEMEMEVEVPRKRQSKNRVKRTIKKNRLSSSSSRSMSPSKTCRDGRQRWGIMQRTDIIEELRECRHMSACKVATMEWGTPPTKVTPKQARDLLRFLRGR